MFTNIDIVESIVKFLGAVDAMNLMQANTCCRDVVRGNIKKEQVDDTKIVSFKNEKIITWGEKVVYTIKLKDNVPHGVATKIKYKYDLVYGTCMWFFENGVQQKFVGKSIDNVVIQFNEFYMSLVFLPQTFSEADKFIAANNNEEFMAVAERNSLKVCRSRGHYIREMDEVMLKKI